MQKEILGTIYTEVSADFQRGIYPIARTIKAEKHDLAVVYAVRGADMEVKQIGNMDNDREAFDNPQCGRVYDSDGLSPTINTCQGGQREPKIIVAMRGRNPDNPSDRTAGIPTEQRLELNSQGICNTLTSVQKDNLVMEMSERFFEQAIETLEKNDCEYGDIINAYNKSVDKSGICPTITTRPEGFKTAILPVISRYRIRKLTPLECWRLMGFSDEDFHKAEEVNSNSQLYKQAGNSIVKNVLMAIFGQMIPRKENIYKEM